MKVLIEGLSTCSNNLRLQWFITHDTNEYIIHISNVFHNICQCPFNVFLLKESSHHETNQWFEMTHQLKTNCGLFESEMYFVTVHGSAILNWCLMTGLQEKSCQIISVGTQTETKPRTEDCWLNAICSRDCSQPGRVLSHYVNINESLE